MTQTIDPIKLKAAAEYLEWVLEQYPESEDVQALLHGLLPLIEDAKAGRIMSPIRRLDIPGAYNFGNGIYTNYKNPNVEDAYVAFSREARGGLSDQEKLLLSEMQESREAMRNGGES
ncbi:MAG: hypothetical protein Q4G62_09760 [Pseudomonadota bacterium]|nr:hypothetical protein [Pseudomonadota bacterium]